MFTDHDRRTGEHRLAAVVVWKGGGARGPKRGSARAGWPVPTLAKYRLGRAIIIGWIFVRFVVPQMVKHFNPLASRRMLREMQNGMPPDGGWGASTESEGRKVEYNSQLHRIRINGRVFIGLEGQTLVLLVKDDPGEPGHINVIEHAIATAPFSRVAASGQSLEAMKSEMSARRRAEQQQWNAALDGDPVCHEFMAAIAREAQ